MNGTVKTKTVTLIYSPHLHRGEKRLVEVKGLDSQEAYEVHMLLSEGCDERCSCFERGYEVTRTGE